MLFTRRRNVVTAEVDAVEIEVLQQFVEQLLGLIEEPEVSDDPLAAMVGMPPGEVPAPDDPILKRLLPDAYRDDDDAAGDFRRFTDHELRSGKRANAIVVGATLPDQPGRISIDRDQCDSWLGFLNDVRLALGTALDVNEDTDYPQDDEDSEATQALNIYFWLGFLQDSLLSCIEPRLP